MLSTEAAEWIESAAHSLCDHLGLHSRFSSDRLLEHVGCDEKIAVRANGYRYVKDIKGSCKRLGSVVLR